MRSMRKGNKKPYIYLSSPHMSEEAYEQAYVKEAFDTNWIAPLGKNVNELEREIKEKLGTNDAVALMTGTSAIHLALKLIGVRRGDVVFCSSFTFAASANPIRYEGAAPVFIDSEESTWNMSPEALRRAFEKYAFLGKLPKAVIVVHLYGLCARMDEIMEICSQYGCPVIEDAAESLGSRYRGAMTGQEWKYTGTFGDYGIISFNGNKIITGSGGGMLLCNTADGEEKGEKARFLATQAREQERWYQHEEIGYNYRMSNVIAGVVRGQYPYLKEHIAQKKAIYERYRKGFAGLPVKMNPYDEKNSEPNFWLSCLLIEPEAMCRQVRGDCEALYVSEPGKSCPTEILETLAKYNAEGRPLWKPMHMQPIYRMNTFVTQDGDGRAKTNAYISGGATGKDGKPLDVGMDLFHRGLCLPSDNKMTAEEQERIIEIIHRCFL